MTYLFIYIVLIKLKIFIKLLRKNEYRYFFLIKTFYYKHLSDFLRNPKQIIHNISFMVVLLYYTIFLIL